MRFLFTILIVSLSFYAVYYMGRDLLPPERLVMAAGPEDGGYYRMASRYRAILARDDIDVEVVVTEGSVENARLLADGEVDVALLQGGVHLPRKEGVDPEDVIAESLGALMFEPILVFVNEDADVPTNPGKWGGLTIAAGSAESGTRRAAIDLVRAAGVIGEDNELLPLGGSAAVEAVKNGEADIAVFVASLESPYLKDVFEVEGVQMMTLKYVPALSTRMQQSQLVALHQGAVSLDPVLPVRDTDLLALVTQMGAQPGLHPALVDRLVNAAKRIHGKRDAITKEEQFPSMLDVSLPENDDAVQALKPGRSWFDRNLPYWAAAQIDRVVFLFVPLLVLLPILRALPKLYGWMSRRRVWKHYKEVREIEDALAHSPDGAELSLLDGRLEELDRTLSSMNLPMAYRKGAYDARLHVDLVRRRIGALRDADGAILAGQRATPDAKSAPA